MEIALFEPEIPPNTGNIIRLTVCTGTSLHIVGKPSFSLEDSMLRRAGLDYWSLSRMQTHESLEDFVGYIGQRDSQSPEEVKGRFLLLSRFAQRAHSEHQFRGNEILLFGRESTGLPDSIRSLFEKAQWLRIPVHKSCRSLNLANSVSIVLYEGLRQLGFPGLETEYSADN